MTPRQHRRESGGTHPFCASQGRTRRTFGARALVARTATVLASVSSCRPAAPAPPGPVASALVATAAELGADPTELVRAWTEIDRIAARVEERHRHSRDRGTGPDVADLNAVIFDELAFSREVDDDDPRFFLLPSVLAAHRGSCLGLGAVYLIVAERVGLPLDGVRVPGHFFVRAGGPSPRNIELLRRGEAMPDAWYREKYGPWPEGNGSYLRPLSVEETSALFWFNAGNRARRQGDLQRAARAYERAAAEAPDFAEAHASLGLERQLEGALSAAERAYRDAARTRADLPGLGLNRALLDQERAAPPPSSSPPSSSPPSSLPPSSLPPSGPSELRRSPP